MCEAQLLDATTTCFTVSSPGSLGTFEGVFYCCKKQRESKHLEGVKRDTLCLLLMKRGNSGGR